MIEQLVNQCRNVLVDAAAVYVFLIVGGRVGDVKIVAPAAVVLSVDAVERIGYDGERVRTQGGDAPGGVNFAGHDVFHIVRKRGGDVGGGAVRRTEMDGDRFGDIGRNKDHTQPS